MMKRLHFFRYSFMCGALLLGGCSAEQLMNMSMSNIEQHYGDNGEKITEVERLYKGNLNLIKQSAQPIFGRVAFGVPTKAQFIENTFIDSKSSKIAQVYAEGRANVVDAIFDAHYKSLQHSNLFADIVRKNGRYEKVENSKNYDLVIWFCQAENDKIYVDRHFRSSSFKWKILEPKSGKLKTLPVDWADASLTVLADWVDDVHSATLELNPSFSENSSVVVQPVQEVQPMSSGQSQAKCSTADKLEFVKAGYDKADIDQMCGG